MIRFVIERASHREALSKVHNHLMHFITRKYFMILQKNYLRFKQIHKFTAVTL